MGLAQARPNDAICIMTMQGTVVYKYTVMIRLEYTTQMFILNECIDNREYV